MLFFSRYAIYTPSTNIIMQTPTPASAFVTSIILRLFYSPYYKFIIAGMFENCVRSVNVQNLSLTTFFQTIGYQKNSTNSFLSAELPYLSLYSFLYLTKAGTLSHIPLPPHHILPRSAALLFLFCAFSPPCRLNMPMPTAQSPGLPEVP